MKRVLFLFGISIETFDQLGCIKKYNSFTISSNFGFFFRSRSTSKILNKYRGFLSLEEDDMHRGKRLFWDLFYFVTIYANVLMKFVDRKGKRNEWNLSDWNIYKTLNAICLCVVDNFSKLLILTRASSSWNALLHEEKRFCAKHSTVVFTH